jgi:glycosyltransferase involved in cell wall biosynthesis
MKNMTRPRILTAVIPALNEEEAIGSTIVRCLSAREMIKRVAGLDDVEIIVVSDGSTDRTVEIAQGFDEVKVIVFEKNRGYGAAIKEGFRQGKGSLVGFIDADGTCDPEYFAEMCRSVVEDADLALGSRLGPTSKMPRIRKLGNRIFALMLGLLCGRRVTDTASGMRVIRRDALAELYPLPDRLHFTPAMSARALLNGLKVVEIPMHYEERIGESKLSVLGDGVRFLKTILDGVLCYRPERLFLLAFIVCLVSASLLGLMPVEYYLSHRSLEEWMIYRLVTCLFLGLIGFMLLSATALAFHMAQLSPRRRVAEAFWPSLAAQLFEGKALVTVVFVATVASLVLLWPGIAEFVTTGHISLHWSRLMVGTFGLLLVVHALITNVMIRILSLWRYQRAEDERRVREHELADLGSTVGAAAGSDEVLVESARGT